MRKLFALLLLFVAAPCWSAVEFGGATNPNYIQMTTTRTIVADFTLAAWCKTFDYTLQRQPIIYSGSAEANGYGLIINQENIHTGRLYVLEGGRAWRDSGVSLTDGLWHHVAATCDALKACVIYVDGVSVFTFTGNPAAATKPVAVGTDNQTQFSAYFYGQIDDARYYSRALSAAEIATLGQSRVRPVITDSPYGWWQLDEGNDGAVVGTVRDMSVNAETGYGGGTTNKPVWRGSTWISYP